MLRNQDNAVCSTFSFCFINHIQQIQMMKQTYIESTDNTLRLDTTDEYLQIGRRKPATTKTEQDAEKQAELKVFYDHAFFFLANKDRILSDSRMFLAPVPIQSGLAYTGTSGFHNPTLGVYLEFWTSCKYTTIIDEDGRKSLVCRIAGSPLSGCNKCDVVFEDGKVEPVQIRNFRYLWPSFMEINRKYDEAKATCESYSLQQVIDILSKEGRGDYDKSAVDAFLYKKAAEFWQERYQTAEDRCKILLKKLRWVKMETKRTQLAELVKETDRLQTEIDALMEELRGVRRTMLKRLHTHEITPAAYQRWWMALPLRKEKNESVENLRTLIANTLESLFPEDYMNVSMQEVRDFVEQQSEDDGKR